MADKYNRTICGFCPSQAACDALRASEGVDKASWDSLPRKCLLAESTIERHSRGVMPVSACPRCDSPKAIVEVDQQWEMGLGRSATALKYVLRCDVCDLDALAEV